MYNWEKSLPIYKTNKNPQNQSFSSTLLAEIDRSIDGGLNQTFDELKLHRSRRPSNEEQSKIRVSSLKPNKTVKEQEEDVHSFRRHFISEKSNPPPPPPCRRHSQPELHRMSREIDFDPVPFSSSSSSSDSSSGGLSSSDVEFNQFTTFAKSRVSCFTVLRPKPVKTKTEKPDGTRSQHPFDELPESDGLVKSKLRAIKIYNNLKKAKQQPVSPGSGRLTNFLNSLFSNNGGNPKKKKKNPSSVSAETSQPSSASSYYRSCLTTREKTNSLVEKKTKVRFDDIIPNRVSLPRGKNADVDIDDVDELSDSSSDLFELDHLAMDKYGEELPVYETTHVHNNIVPNRNVR